MMKLTDLTLSEVVEKLQQREISSLDLTRAYLRRIEEIDGTLNAYLTVTAELALEQASAADQARARGDQRPLLGVLRQRAARRSFKAINQCSAPLLFNVWKTRAW
jgi:aspartyl-tRNA(Asn)/glutamyl-tRNA(Gln) amidotransferase subunit A